MFVLLVTGFKKWHARGKRGGTPFFFLFCIKAWKLFCFIFREHTRVCLHFSWLAPIVFFIWKHFKRKNLSPHFSTGQSGTAFKRLDLPHGKPVAERKNPGLTPSRVCYPLGTHLPLICRLEFRVLSTLFYLEDAMGQLGLWHQRSTKCHLPERGKGFLFRVFSKKLPMKCVLV